MKKFEGLKNILVILLHPMSPVVVLIVGGIISAIENEQIGLKDFKGFFNQNEKILIWLFLIILLIAWIILCIVVSTFEENNRKHIKKIEKIEKDLEEKSEKIKNYEEYQKLQTSICLGKYGDFFDFQLHQHTEKALMDMVNKNCDLQAIQLYKVSKGNETISNKKCVMFKINFYLGYAQSNVEINAMMQERYLIPKNYYSIMKTVDFSKKPEKDKIQSYTDLSKLMYDDMNDRKNSGYFEFDYTLDSFITWIDDYLGFSESQRDKQHQILSKCKRMDILKSIMYEKTEIFTYGKNNVAKRGRCYLCLNLDIIDNNFIALIVTDGEKLTNEVSKGYYDELKQRLLIC